jgi:WD40 repeat protein
MDSSGSGSIPAGGTAKDGLEEAVSAVGLAALLRADQRRRWLAGERVPVEDYLGRYPGLAENAEALLELVYGEFVLREEQGEGPQADDYLRRFPGHAGALGRVFELHRSLAGTGRPPSTAGRAPEAPELSATVVRAPLTHVPAAPAGPAETIPELMMVAGYEVLEVLGKGGMGVVYKARQQGLDRTVALKMIRHAGDACPAARARFDTEARAVARLQHPNIVQVHDVGEHNGCPYLALEFCGGGSLANRLDGTPWPADKAAALVQALARAMHAAHQARIVHRDLKPANILLTEDGTPKVTDFGLARRLDEVGHTLSGEVLGTPTYMAPEQAEGRTREVGPAADVYALGVILYELLTGRPPFKAATALETVRQVLSEEPVSVRRLQPKVPRDLETICLKCLEKTVGKRYGSAEALVEDLARFLSRDPIRARPAGPLGRAARWVKRRPVTATLAVVAVVAAGLLVGLGLWFSARMGAARGELAAEEARGEAAHQRAQLQEYFGLVRQARERRARPQAGWTWDNLQDLRKAAALPPAAEHVAELRTEAAAALGAADVCQPRLVGRGVNAYCLAFHPGGRLLALGELKAAGYVLGAVRLIDCEGREPPRSLAFPPQPVWESGLVQDGVRSLAFSPDGRWLLAGARSGQLHRWDLSRQPPARASWAGHDKEVTSLLFGADGSALFSASANGRKVKRWDCRPWEGPSAEPRPEHTWEAPGAIDGLALHPTEGWLACHAGNRLHALSADTLRAVQPPADRGGPRLQFAPNGTLAWADQGVIRCEHLGGAEPLRRLFLAPDSDRSEDGWIEHLIFSPRGDLLLSASTETKHVKLWEVAGGRLVADFFAGGGHVAAAFAPDGRTLAVTADSRTLLYEVGGRDGQTFAAQQPQSVEAMALHPDGRSLACLSQSASSAGLRDVGVWALGEGAGALPVARHTLPAPRTEARPLCFHPRRPLLALGAGGTLAFWNTAGQRSPSELAGVTARALRFAPDGRVWGAVGNEVCAWEPGGTRPGARWNNAFSETLTGLPGIYDVAAGRDHVAAGGRNGMVYLLRAADGSLVNSAPLNAGAVLSVALGAGETLAAAGTDKGELRLLRLPSAEVVGGDTAHRDAVTAVAFAGSLLASGSRDRTVRLWRCDGGRLDEVLTLPMPGPVRGLAFHPDGVRLFVLLERERAVRVWHLDGLRTRLEALGLAGGLEGIEAAPLPPAATGR